jgi:hypothetical protein
MVRGDHALSGRPLGQVEQLFALCTGSKTPRHARTSRRTAATHGRRNPVIASDSLVIMHSPIMQAAPHVRLVQLLRREALRAAMSRYAAVFSQWSTEAVKVGGDENN